VVPGDGHGQATTTIMTMGGGYAQGKQILVDPMTKEVISAEDVLDASGKPVLDNLRKPVLKERDRWFEMSFKLKWSNAPEMPASPTATEPGMGR
jgi:hypothetical protein